MKQVWKLEAYLKTSHFEQHIKLVLISTFNGVFIFISLQTKTRKKSGIVFRPHCTPGVAVVQVAAVLGSTIPSCSCPGGSFPGRELF